MPDAPDEWTVECHDLLDAREPIRQGDVLEWLRPQDGRWGRHGIVVTADCDIVHHKHGGSLATVPVLRYDDYLASFTLPAKLRAAETTIRATTRSLIRSMQASYRPDRPGVMSDDAIDGWIAHEDPDAILKTLHVADADATVDLRTRLRWLCALPMLEESGRLPDQIDALTHAKVLNGSNKARATLRTSLARESIGRVENLPGDALFLHSLGGAMTEGYVAYLRQINSLDEAAVAVRVNEIADKTKLARRISRLSSPFVFRLTQQLGQVFSAVGLPGSYENSRSRFVAQQADTLAVGQ